MKIELICYGIFFCALGIVLAVMAVSVFVVGLKTIQGGLM